MKTRLSIATITLLGCLLGGAQNVAEEPKADPVLEAIEKFQNRNPEKPNEVSVTLDPVGDSPAPVKDESKPLLVIGKAPEETTPPAPSEQTPPDAVTTEAEAPKPQNELAVRVEKLHTGKGVIDPAQVKLLAPFPAKPLAQAPAGWRLDASDSAPPFTREVEISPGSKITLTIRPHLLIPDADGAEVFTISEPGYENALGYQQTATVGAILSNSIRQLDEESKQLGTAIDNLQQLLVSLPKPAPQPEPQPESKPVINRKR
jgi:hypothetical protein